MGSVKETQKRSIRNNYFLKAFFPGPGAVLFGVHAPFFWWMAAASSSTGISTSSRCPFTRLAHDAVRSGNLGWSHLTDLGANFVGSYSFLPAGQPLFLADHPLPPRSGVQYLMGPLLILKFACATLTGYIYIHRYTKNQDSALIAAVLYAFSGFSVYNIFFNHFHEAIVFFPLLLAALDEYMATRRRGLFAPGRGGLPAW